jgi:purine catabolism regulator
MPLTLRTLVDMPQLQLKVLAAEASLSAVVSWVAVSELADPTPFLEGGELLLTTGMRLPTDARELDAYVDRLADAGVVGLGLGVGLGHDTAPEVLVKAAERRGLPLLEVPRPVPFIAISKAVSDLLAAGRSERMRRAFESQRELTHAALLPQGSGAVAARLARELECWVAVLDSAGRLMCAVPDAAADRVPELQPELDELRSAGLHATRSLAVQDEQIIIHPLGANRRTRGFLVVGLRPPVTSTHHTVLNTAVALLSLDVEKSLAQVNTERRLRSAWLNMVLAGPHHGLEDSAKLLGGSLPSPAGRVALIASRDPGSVLDVLEDDATLAEAGVIAAPFGDHITVLLPDDAKVLDQFTSLVSQPSLRVGIGGAVCTADLSVSARQAEQALSAAGQARRVVCRYDELANDGLLDLLDSEAVRAFSASVLAPLDSYSRASRTDLVASLRAYLAHNGQWDPAAAELGVHRHTLRYRMRRITELLGRDLESTNTRMELWLALTVREHLDGSVSDNS